MTSLKIGVVGYSGQKFDEVEANEALERLLDEASAGHTDVTIVSGLTDLGIPGLAYRIAVARGWKTAGVACSKAMDYECFPVDEQHIVGNNWGEESSTFLGMCGAIVRVGGGKQSMQEVGEFRGHGGLVFEHDMPALPSS